MPFCTKCGTRFEAGTAFCGNCGNAVAATATPDMESPVNQQSSREVPVSDAPAPSTFAAASKNHILPKTLPPSPKAPPKTMGERVALSLLMFILGVPIMFIVFIAINWAVDGSLTIEIPHGIQLRLSIFIPALFAVTTIFHD